MAFPETPLALRHELRLGEVAMSSSSPGVVAGINTGTCYSVDKTAYDITGDLDIRIEVTLEDWTPFATIQLATKNRSYGLTSPDWSWSFILRSDGKLEFDWTTAGTFGTVKSAVSTVATGFTDGTRHALRATMDVNNGSSGYTVTFYTASDIDGSWSALGSAVTAAGVTSIAATAANLEIASTNDGAPGTLPVIGKVHGYELRSGIGGTIVSKIDFSLLTPGATSFTDLYGNTWFLTQNMVIDQDWVDVTSDTYDRGKITVTRGRSGEGQRADAGSCTTQINNRTGDYSPRNPNGTYYGVIGRNTRQRVNIQNSATTLWLYGDNHSAFCADSAGISVTGDLDLRWDGDLINWSSGSSHRLIFKLYATQCSYALYVLSTGALRLYWSADGTNLLSADSTVPVALPHFGRKAVRATIDVNNGAAGRTITFYTSDTISGTWTQLGDAVVQAGTTSIFDGTSELSVRGPVFTRLYAARVLSGIAGTTVASPDFTAQTAGARSFTDAQSNRWFLTSQAEITDRDDRFHGEVSEWPQRWDTSGADVYVPISGAGAMRRLGQGSSPLASTLKRGMKSRTEAVGYWPCEDADGSTQVASGLAGGQAATLVSGTPQFGASSNFVCSAPLPTTNGANWIGNVNSYTDTDQEYAVWALVYIPTALASEITLFRWWNKNSTVPLAQLNADASGNLRLQLINFTPGLTVVKDSGTLAHAVTGKLLRIAVELYQNGTSVDYTVLSLEVGESSGTPSTGTVASQTLGQCGTIDVNPSGSLTDTVIGHVAVSSPHVPFFDLFNELQAWAGETAGNRMIRLCDENDVDRAVIGSPSDTVQMGAQGIKTLLDLLRECEDADMGVLYEPRDFLGLAYRTRKSLLSQADLGGVSLALDYSAADLSSIEPTDDDQNTRNDITVTRSGGSSANEAEMSGPLSVGRVGRYDSAVTVNIYSDLTLADQASWRLHLGTVDESRYPALGMELARANFASDANLTAAARALDVGGKVTVDNPPAWLPPDQIQQLAIGFREVLQAFMHTITVNCVPETPYQVAIYDDTESRYEVDYSALSAAATSGATSLTVSTPSGPVWGTADLPYDIAIGGERMTVTAVSGSSTPQTFTVTRAVNGIAKAHGIGAEVRLFKRVYYDL